MPYWFYEDWANKCGGGIQHSQEMAEPPQAHSANRFCHASDRLGQNRNADGNHLNDVLHEALALARHCSDKL